MLSLLVVVLGFLISETAHLAIKNHKLRRIINNILFAINKIDKIVKKYINEKIVKNKYKNLLEYLDVEYDKFQSVFYNFVPFQSWIEFRVTLPVEPHKQSEVTTEITHEILQLLNKYPDKIGFPKGRNR